MLLGGLPAGSGLQVHDPADARGAVERMRRLHQQVQRLHFRVENEFNTAQRVELTRQLIALRSAYESARRQAEFLTDPFVRRSRQIVEELLREAFPELSGKRFVIHPITSENTYFSSFFSFKEPLLRRNRIYRLGINLQVFRQETLPPWEGVRGILCHELAHSLDYRRRNFFQIWGVLAIFLKPTAHRRFERWADLQAISRGCGPGLKAYRRWVYQQVTTQEEERRRMVYYPPEQIESIEDIRGRCPSAMPQWLIQPPLNPEEIQASECGP